jgi:hypothetical protein
VQGQEAVEEQPAEEAGQHAHRQEEASAARDPGPGVGGQATAWGDDVKMRMMGHRRSPRVQHGGQPDARAEMPGVGRDGEERLRRRPEQQVVDGGLVREGDGRDGSRDREDEMVVGDRQEIGLAVGEPVPGGVALALGAVPVAAGIVGDAGVVAAVTARDMSTEACRPTGPDRRDDLDLVAAERMTREEGVAVLAQDVRDLECRPRHGGDLTAAGAPSARTGS